MTDQVKAIENLLAANQATKPRTNFLEVAAGGLTTALANTQEHISELARQCEARRAQVVRDQEALQKLHEQVQADAAAGQGAAPAANN